MSYAFCLSPLAARLLHLKFQTFSARCFGDYYGGHLCTLKAHCPASLGKVLIPGYIKMNAPSTFNSFFVGILLHKIQ